MTRIKKTFEDLKQSGKTALVTFTMLGDPDLKNSLKILKSLPESGADIIEIGMPFTDPVADGLTIQLAGGRALNAGANMHHTIDMVRKFRKTNDHTPIILMGYANPIFVYGYEKFAQDASDAGVDGLIIVDLPPEEDADLREYTKKYNIDIIRLITPTTDEKRLAKILDGASGFLYYVSITGVTGAAKADKNALKPHIDMIKSHTTLPIAIGFGIKTPDDALKMSSLGDGIVVGSVIVEKVKDTGNGNIEPVLSLVKSLSNVLK